MRKIAALTGYNRIVSGAKNENRENGNVIITYRKVVSLTALTGVNAAVTVFERKKSALTATIRQKSSVNGV